MERLEDWNDITFDEAIKEIKSLRQSLGGAVQNAECREEKKDKEIERRRKALKEIKFMAQNWFANRVWMEGMTASEVRIWLKQHEDRLPYPVRLEDGVDWVHLDCRNAGVKVYIFNP